MKYQKNIEGLNCKDNFYKPKYSEKRIVISEEDFIEQIDQTQLYESYELDEHRILNLLLNRVKGEIDIILKNDFLSRQVFEEENLLFYHWYERRYKKNIINSDILFALNGSSILGWFDKFSREELYDNIGEKLQKGMCSQRFHNFTIYYEYYFDFFPKIEIFTFEEFKRKPFLNYLLELFPQVVAIDYLNKKNLWRITEEQIIESGDDYHNMSKMDRNKTHNPILYSENYLPCFYPSKIGDKNYEYYKIDSTKVHTPLFKIVNQRTREIENEIRQERGVPKIGEGWVSETLLYYNIKKSFKKYHVIQHGSPNWLGLQHFDIYIPELNIAIEYQGTQHQNPVDYFGGEEAFAKGQERDSRKKKLCEENGCLLLYVFPDDNLNKFIKKLKRLIKEVN
ncbi:MAG: hypothetical protein K9I95_04625 [Flavobacteriaceae bacterium]|nr:hypothetical protein [Flavobacteriaceae bacterium]